MAMTDTTIAEVIASNFRRLLDKHKYSLARVEQKSDGRLNNATLSRLYNAMTPNPGVGTLLIVAEALDEPLAELLVGIDKVDPNNLPPPISYFMNRFGASKESAMVLQSLADDLVARERGEEPNTTSSSLSTNKKNRNAADTLIGTLMDELVSGMFESRSIAEEERDDSIDKLLPHWKKLSHEQRLVLINLVGNMHSP